MVSFEDLLPFFLSDEEQNGKKLGKRNRMKKKAETNNMHNLITFLSCIVSRCSPDPQLDDDEATIPNMEDDDKEAMIDKRFWMKVIKDGANINDSLRLAQYWCWDNIEVSKIIITIICKLIDKTDFSELKPILDFFAGYLQMLSNDSVAIERSDIAMSYLMHIMEEKKKWPKKTKELINFARRIISEDKLSARYFRQSQEHQRWIKDYINTFS